MRKIENRYDGASCRECGSEVAKGETVHYDPEGGRGEKIICESCYADTENKARQDLGALTTADPSELEEALKDYPVSDFPRLTRDELDDFGAVELRKVGVYVMDSHTAIHRAKKSDLITAIRAQSVDLLKDPDKMKAHKAQQGEKDGESYGETRNGEGGESRGQDGEESESKDGQEKQEKSSTGLEDAIMELVRNNVDEIRDELNLETDIEELEEAVLELVEEQSLPKTIKVKHRDHEVEIEGVHESFDELVQLMSAGVNVLLKGEAGGGKSTAVSEAANALDLDFGYVSLSPDTPRSAVFGYMDASGTYVETEFFRRYTEGGVFLIDEWDNSNPHTLISLNQAVSGDKASFPHGMFEKHEDFIAVAAANTIGKGGTEHYRRLAQDGAQLDRFRIIDWKYDEGFERQLALSVEGADESKVRDLVDKVQKIRKIVHNLGIGAIVSPRASIEGAKELAVGFDVDDALRHGIFNRLDEDTTEKIKRRM